MCNRLSPLSHHFHSQCWDVTVEVAASFSQSGSAGKRSLQLCQVSGTWPAMAVSWQQLWRGACEGLFFFFFVEQEMEKGDLLLSPP